VPAAVVLVAILLVLGPLLMIKQPHRSEMKMLKELLLRYSSTLMNVLKAVFWIFKTLLNFKGCYRPSIK